MSLPEQSGGTGWEGGNAAGHERSWEVVLMEGGRGGFLILQYSFWGWQSVWGQGVERDEVPDADKRWEETAPEGVCPSARDY